LNDSSIPRNLPDFEKFTRGSFYLGIKSTSIYREKNDDYIPPKVNYHIINHELCNEEILIYRNIKKIINDLNKELNRFKLMGDTENTKKFNSYLLSMITNLRQFIIQPIYPIAKMIVQMSKMGKKDELAIRFNESIEELDINEWLDNEESAFSSRLKNIFNTIEKHNDEKLIIFGCFKKFLHIIVHYLDKNKCNRDLYMLNNNIQSREKTINEFENSKNGIMLLTYDMGAQGFNFQHCKNVLLIDLWWNYDKIKQAMCRIVRPGQKQETNVYFFISNIGIEHALLKMQKQKLNLAKKYFEGGSITDKIDRIKIQNIIKFLNEENYELLSELNEEDLY
jgi:SNF2 family DNA or RNA helicase